jgi:hypothetical protein
MLRAALLILVALPPLAACGPVPLDQAERLCVEEANLARRPRGKAVGAFDVTVSTDFLLGRDPAQVFDACVKARSGQFPARSLDAQPGWVG